MPQVSTVPPEALPQIPSALQVEHRVIHEALLRATKAPGDIGTAARELAGALHDHFVREEEIALPPLGLLAALALLPYWFDRRPEGAGQWFSRAGRAGQWLALGLGLLLVGLTLRGVLR